MSDTVFFDGKKYSTTKQISDRSTYSPDYIGQLARKGVLESRILGGIRYISVDSFDNFLRNGK